MILPENLNDAQRDAIINCLRILAEIGADGIEEEDNEHRSEAWIDDHCGPQDHSAEKADDNPDTQSVRPVDASDYQGGT